MPKIAKGHELKLVELVGRNIILRCNQLGLYTECDIADRIKMKRCTFHLRKSDPASWRLIEITRAAVELGASLEWLCTDHTAATTKTR